MSAIVVCLDCPNYRNGGWCRLKNKDTGALTPACADANKTKEEVLEERHDILTKRCTKCGRLLPVENFSLHKTNLDGRQSVCKECQKELYKAWDERRKAKKAKESEDVRDFKEWTKTQSNIVIKEEPMETTNTTTKTCKKCGRTLTLDHFYTNKGKPNSICKECKKEEVKSYKKPKEAKAPRKPAEQPVRIAVRETLTDKQMVDLLREHGWTVTCEKYEKLEL